MDMIYENDDRMVSMEDIEIILTNRYGNSEYARESGCSTNGGWLSIEKIHGLWR